MRVRSFLEVLLWAFLAGAAALVAPRAPPRASHRAVSAAEIIEERGWYSAEQLKAIRKVVDRRRAQRQLATVIASDDEATALSSATIAAVDDLLEAHEVVEIRGIHRADVRRVRAIAEDFADAIGGCTLCNYKGHAAVYFRQKPEDSAVALFAKPDRYVPKPKAIRDAFGRIIGREDQGEFAAAADDDA